MLHSELNYLDLKLSCMWMIQQEASSLGIVMLEVSDIEPLKPPTSSPSSVSLSSAAATSEDVMQGWFRIKSRIVRKYGKKKHKRNQAKK